MQMPMPNNAIKMNKLRQVLRLGGSAHGTRSIAVMLGLSRTTVRKYLRIYHRLGLSLGELLSKDDATLYELFQVNPNSGRPESPSARELMALLPSYARRLRKRGMTKKRLFEEYRREHPAGYSKSRFNSFLLAYMEQGKTVMHIEHRAGERMFIDFAGDRLRLTDPITGKRTAVEVFVAILPCSQLTYVEAVMSQDKEHLIAACRHALEYFGGAPRIIVPDNLKSAVKKPGRYEAVINDDFEAFAEHYGCAVVPARVRRPRDKALVEDAVRLTYQRIYPMISDEDAASVELLNAAIRKALEVHNNTPLTGRPYSRREQFEDIERPALCPLPERPFELHNRCMLTVQRNGHIRLHGHFYSVPYSYAGRKVSVFYNSSDVDVYIHYRLIAHHPRSAEGFGYTTAAEHLPPGQRMAMEDDPTPYIRQAGDIHPVVQEYLRMVATGKKVPQQACNACRGILALGQKAGKERLVAACRLAMQLQAYNYAAVEHILRTGQDRTPAPEDGTVPESTPRHANIRGKDYYN